MKKPVWNKGMKFPFKHRKVPTILECTNCQKSFSKPPSQARKKINRFCSMSCYISYSRVIVLCAICEIPKLVPKSKLKTRKEITCSSVCFRKLLSKNAYKLQNKRVAQGIHLFGDGSKAVLKVSIVNHSKYKQWRTSVYQKDGFTCQKCKNCNKLNADHIKPFALIIHENKITSLQEALDCKELWNIENGRTLCLPCHRKTKTWGVKTRWMVHKLKTT